MLEADIDACTRHPWDVIVIGTGIGGATLGHRLAQAGKRVLFCERGPSHLNPGADAPPPLVGRYPEQRTGGSGTPQGAEAVAQFRAGGRYVDRIHDESARPYSFVPFIGSGTGGSSALYGMALERFFPSDFAPRANHPDAPDAALDEAWPIRYDDLAPYYDAAEVLYRVRGGADPLRGTDPVTRTLRAPPPLTPAADELFVYLQGRGLHPYRLPMACEFVPGCAGCQGFLCAKSCKNDAAQVCLAPALREHGATLLDGCEALRIEADRSRVTGVVCRGAGRTFTLHAAQVVLAAGALQTPRLLLASASADWPGGLANPHDLVGRFLMRHCVDLYAVAPAHPSSAEAPLENRLKELAFNDFYDGRDGKLGTVQSFGRLPPPEMLFASLRQDVMDGRFGWAAPGLALVRPFLEPFLAKLVGGNLMLATTMEDLPYADNRVSLAPGAGADVTLTYRVRPADARRIRRFRDAMRQVLQGRRWRLIAQAENNQRIAHVCGTCRFGLDRKTSVLDENNRAHGLDNLYVVDSSFFPSSGGTNPSLTIAANALRVADHMK